MIGLDLLQAVVKRNEQLEQPLLFQWVAADELYGDSSAFRDGVAALNKWYFTEIKTTSQVWLKRPEVYVPAWKGRGRRPTRLRLCHPTDKAVTVQTLVAQIPPPAWIRATIKEGSKGPIVCDFAFLRLVESRAGLPGPELLLVIRRNLDNPAELKFYFSNAPAHIPLLDLVRLSGMRWPVEIIFEEGNGELGFDHYETRSWLGWHHHLLLVTLAHHFLVRLRLKFKDKAPALTLYQVRLLFVGAFILNSQSGLGRGFDEFDDTFDVGGKRTAFFSEYQRRAGAVEEKAGAWLDRVAAGRPPFFAWVHFYDPHSPYDPPRPYDARYAKSPYDGEVAFADAQLATLLAVLRSAGLSDRTLVVVAGDHGESLGEHGEATHGMLVYEGALRVPLVLAGPGIAPAGRADPVSLADLARTVLGLLGPSMP